MVPQTLLLSPNTLKTLLWWKIKGEREEEHVPLQSTAAEGAEPLVDDAAFPSHGPGNIGGTERHLFTACFFPIGKSRCAKSNRV